MEYPAVDQLWFNTPDSPTLCRGGGNGPNHPSQLYAIKKYIPELYNELGPIRFLDYGSGSATTLEAWLSSDLPKEMLIYTGVDIIPKNIEWCRARYPDYYWDLNPTLHKIDKPDRSYDVVYSRHVVDHMKSFEEALDEHCRVARKLVIIVLWRPLGTSYYHQIKNIVDQGKTYENEYTNDYSKQLVIEALESKQKDGWFLRELAEGVGQEVKGFDTVIVLDRKG